ncbi:surface lipoprotein assembly modifier [Morganella psychrotolerans]|uniref:surface lipoprotein assembly modifier n=1 Tax=Morganella psychrotolerans TaxID=368603 RepID=UPI0039B03C85
MSLQIKLLYGFNLFLLLISFLFSASISANKKNTTIINRDTTAKYLYLSLKQNNLKNIYHYLSAYQKENQADPLLILFSQAKLAYLNQRPGLAILLYQAILEQKPHFFTAQLELARSYRADRQTGNALSLFRALSQRLPVTSPHYPEITRTITELSRALSWSLMLSAGSHYNNNYYQTPEPGAHCLHYNPDGSCYANLVTQKPHAVLQWRSDWDLRKLTALTGSHFLTQHYHTATRYDAANQVPNTLTMTAKAGYHYQDRHTLWQLTPVFEQHISAGTRFSANYGLHTYLHQQLSPHWSLSGRAALKRHRFQPRLHSHNGTEYQLMPQITWRLHPATTLYLQGEATVHRKNDPYKHYRTAALHAGLSHLWHPFFSQSVHAVYSRKRYNHIHPLHRHAREDRSQQYSTTLAFYPPSSGQISPQLSLIHTRNHSTIPWLYTYRQTEIMLRFERLF